MEAKLGAYIDCFNCVDAQVHTGAKHCACGMDDPVVGSAGRESGMTCPYDIDDCAMKECDALASAAVAADPSLPKLDAAAWRDHDALGNL
ncbi:DUF3829 domain-containing protein [Xanthomonas fragariae]|uniref:Lipoprotein n=1 Tax=Xanthomonas fragariae TaxID=48664 RepID=A0A1Y6HKV1_9XANT|nr:DUF3829 domain-containing protein [Xanthomonas fragariae]AOD13954.1 hypothetical protein BER92_03460 [Xanthomonas fragariae]AOD17339.1 hypothetical protein BER93_03460 [Xanthomonas fragariae]ENZ94176.1 hypothetical protein O1K_17338 [Xanthomonas fragariae LMG 25863]MBL9197689.1 DUF3829 domain-containing protein [Xanthomonas fragariae]MBL9222840.1 DUF3829 domain-containing protein [Xanthomonas fragariae]